MMVGAGILLGALVCGLISFLWIVVQDFLGAVSIEEIEGLSRELYEQDVVRKLRR